MLGITANTPIIGGLVGVPDIYQNGQNYFLAQPGNTQQMWDAMSGYQRLGWGNLANAAFTQKNQAFANSMNALGNIFGVGQGLFNDIMAWKGYNLAKDAFNLNKSQVLGSWDLASKQYNAKAGIGNDQMSAFGGSPVDVYKPVKEDVRNYG